MNATTREQWLTVAFPAIMVVIAWWGWFRPSAEHAATTKQLAAARANAVQPQTLRGEQMKLAKLQADQQTLEARYEQLVGRWTQIRAGIGANGNRTHAIAGLAALFARHHLKLIREEPLASGGNGKLPTTLSTALEKADRSAEELVPELKAGRDGQKAATPPRGIVATPTTSAVSTSARGSTSASVWQVEFEGAFADVLAALADLRDGDCHALPVSISMQKAKSTTPLRRWTLLVRI